MTNSALLFKISLDHASCPTIYFNGWFFCAPLVQSNWNRTLSFVFEDLHTISLKLAYTGCGPTMHTIARYSCYIAPQSTDIFFTQEIVFLAIWIRLRFLMGTPVYRSTARKMLITRPFTCTERGA